MDQLDLIVVDDDLGREAGDDADRARAFYREVFEWDIQFMPEMGYNIVATGPQGDEGIPAEPGYIGGGMLQRQDPVRSPVIVLDVPDIDSTLAVVGQHGGTTLRAKMPVGEMGFAAYFTDSEGNVMGLWQSA